MKWLLAVPHLLVVTLFVGGTTWIGSRGENGMQWSAGGGGIVGILVLVAGIVLAVTGTYPRALFDVVLGMDRWALRVAGYVLLMTDAYPPFRFDSGAGEPGTVLPQGVQRLEPGPGPGPAGGPPAGPVWGLGRTSLLVGGAVGCALALGLLAGGGRLLVADRSERDQAGFFTSQAVALTSQGYAVTTTVDLGQPRVGGTSLPGRLLGTARIRVTATDPARPVFVGVAPTGAVDAYLSGVALTSWRDAEAGSPVQRPGGAPGGEPAAQRVWAMQASGAGTQVISWVPTAGDWTLVVMNADAADGVAVRADAAATVPGLGRVGSLLMLGGLVVLVVAGALAGFAVRSAGWPAAATGPDRERVLS